MIEMNALFFGGFLFFVFVQLNLMQRFKISLETLTNVFGRILRSYRANPCMYNTSIMCVCVCTYYYLFITNNFFLMIISCYYFLVIILSNLRTRITHTHIHTFIIIPTHNKPHTNTHTHTYTHTHTKRS